MGLLRVLRGSLKEGCPLSSEGIIAVFVAAVVPGALAGILTLGMFRRLHATGRARIFLLAACMALCFILSVSAWAN